MRRRLLALLLGTLLAFASGELGLRWLVLSDSALAQRLGERFRKAELYASTNDDDFWKLVTRFEHPQEASALWPDARTGWRKQSIAAVTYAHADEAALGERTPVLLYGDSFAEGGQAGAETFEGLLEASELHERYALLNYGVGGYGADQVLLLAQASLPRFEARHPLAILALLVDEDLDRAILGFRGGPKPRLRVVRGELVAPLPVETDLQRYLERHPIGIVSYFGESLRRVPGLLPAGLQERLRGDESRLAEKQELAEAIARSACRELRRRAQRSALFLMRAQLSVSLPADAFWQDALLRRVAAEEGLPVFDSREALLQAVAGRLELLGGYYIDSGPRIGHWNGKGNLVAFQLLRAFLEGGTESDALAHVDELVGTGALPSAPARLFEGRTLGGALSVQYREDSDALCITQSPEGSQIRATWFLALRAGNRGATALRWSLPAGTRRITLRLRVSGAAERAQEAEGLLLRAGSQSLELHLGDAARELALELAEPLLELSVASPRHGRRSPWLLLDQLRLE